MKEATHNNSADFQSARELITDNFAGGGGASVGIRLATGREVDIAVNHDPDAVRMHKTNHPGTQHLQTDVFDVDPRTVCGDRPVGLAWFSPDCKHFFKAKGGKPVSKKIRGLAWIVLRWAGTVKPRVIILENVPEFKTWGPVRRGRPVKSKAGQTFDRWLFQLRELGYDVDYRELVAADYGTPTIRKRFFLIARCDGKPIVWPEPTHNKNGTDGKSKWRGAAEIIDWSLPCPIVFDSKREIRDTYGLSAVRPLADNTMRRIVRGVDKFVIHNGKPFIVPVGYGERLGQEPRVHNIDEPLPTSVSNAKHYVCTPTLVQCKFNNTPENVNDPLRTVTGVNAHLLVAPFLIQYHTEKSEHVRGQSVTEPVMTVDATNRYGLAAAYMTEYFGNADRGFPLTEPTHTATSKDREGLALAFISKFYGTCIGQEAHDPLHTVTTSPGHLAEVRAFLIPWDGVQNLYHWPKVRELLNEHCGYNIPEDMVLILRIGGEDWFISEIGLRMLTPRELYNANGFPPDYIIDYYIDANGKKVGQKKDKQVARCGNAVPPRFAEALVRANLPEWCGARMRTMAELEGAAVG